VDGAKAPRILGVILSPGTRMGCERLDGPPAGLEGCLDSKNHKHKAIWIMQHPDRFLFLLLFLSFLLPIS
jgi:hypothetical protein